MDRSDLQSLLDELRSSFDYERFRDSRKPVQSHDSFWVETFHQYYVEVDDGKKGRDDLLFYVKLGPKQDTEVVEVLRRDSKSLPKRTNRGVLWEQTLYLNVLLHEFAYHVSSAVLTVKPKSDSVDKIMTKVNQIVYPSPIERRMDSKGKVAQVAYPNIVFCIDNFEDIFSQVFTSKQGQKVAVQLLATNDRVSLEKLVFLGAIDHTTLMETVDEKEQVSLSSKLKKQLSLRSKSSKVYDTQHSYHFIQMRGPKLKGYAEMAVIRRDSSYIEQPGVFTYSDESHSHVPNCHSDDSDSHSNDLDPHSSVFQPSENVDPTLSASDSESANSLTVGVGGTNQGGSMQGGKYSPKLRQAFLGQSSGASSSISARGELERDHAAPLSPTSLVSRGSCSSQTGLINDNRDDDHISHSIYSHSDVADYNKRSVVLKEGRGHSRMLEKYDKLSSKSNSHSTITKNKSRDSMKDLFLTFTRGSKKYKEEEHGDLMFAYLTYIQLPWYVLMEDILNSTRPKVL